MLRRSLIVAGFVGALASSGCPEPRQCNVDADCPAPEEDCTSYGQCVHESPGDGDAGHDAGRADDGGIIGRDGQLGVCCPRDPSPGCDCTYLGGWARSYDDCVWGVCDHPTFVEGVDPYGCPTWRDVGPGGGCLGGFDAGIDAGFDGGLDSGHLDAGRLDAGRLDAGPRDAGPLDAGG
jgi:hypothetical protein